MRELRIPYFYLPSVGNRYGVFLIPIERPRFGVRVRSVAGLLKATCLFDVRSAIASLAIDNKHFFFADVNGLLLAPLLIRGDFRLNGVCTVDGLGFFVLLLAAGNVSNVDTADCAEADDSTGLNVLSFTSPVSADSASFTAIPLAALVFFAAGESVRSTMEILVLM